ncbi:MAG TPA: dihydrodipicolinate reductase C-terminal domain-containing protein [Pyrinomonadaceae bacterium]|nr:dihydrodipicolinate reductase C-terminal domain-containing protein [Pyrinomonadaceae bacterium]
MNIALIGFGAMGKLLRMLAEEKGHEIAVIVDDGDAGLSAAELATKLRGCNAAIDFSTAEAVRRNVEACLSAGVALVEGTTGWNEERFEIEKAVIDGNGAMVFGANFSIGVTLFYRIADLAAELFAKFPEYEAFIEEQHHSRKKDAPSGTALKLKAVVSKHVEVGDIASTRAGNIPGTHRVGFDGTADQILLEHTARSREGFALGAIVAAEWIIGKKGCWEFSDVVEEIIAASKERPKNS